MNKPMKSYLILCIISCSFKFPAAFIILKVQIAAGIWTHKHLLEVLLCIQSTGHRCCLSTTSLSQTVSLQMYIFCFVISLLNLIVPKHYWHND